MPDSSAAATSLEAAVARSAEVALDRVASARAAIGTVIFGQERVGPLLADRPERLGSVFPRKHASRASVCRRTTPHPSETDRSKKSFDRDVLSGEVL